MLLTHLDLLATAPNGVARLRELILTLAVQGKLVPQDPADEPASVLLAKIAAEKERLIAEGKIKRGKPLAGITDGGKPFKLPAGWAWERFGAIAEIERGGSPRPIQSFLTDEPDGVNWIKIGDTEKGGKYITSSSEKIRREGLSKTRMVFPGDFLLTNSMSFGRPYITQIEGCIHDGWLRVCPPSSLNKDFLYTLLSSRFIRTVFEGAAAGAVVLNLNADKVRIVPIPLPPLTEQSRIVTRVEELMELCDALEAKGKLEAAQHARLVSTLLSTLTDSASPEVLAENWQRVSAHFDLLLDRPEAVDALEQTLLQLAVRGLLVPQDPQDEPASILLARIRAEKDRLIAEGKIKRGKPLAEIAEEEKPFGLPVGWEWGRLGLIGFTQTGGTPSSTKPEYFIGDFPFIGPGQITSTGEILPAEKHISELACLQSAVVEPGDILMVCIGGSIGKCAMTFSAISFNQQINSIHPLLVRSEYVLIAMTASQFRSSVISASTGSATPIISKGKWDLLLLPLPPIKEQSRIVTRVTQLRQLCADLRQRLKAAQSTQALLAQALIEEVA